MNKYIFLVIGIIIGIILFKPVFAQISNIQSVDISNTQVLNVSDKGQIEVLDTSPKTVFKGTRRTLELKIESYEQQIVDLQKKIDEANLWLENL